MRLFYSTIVPIVMGGGRRRRGGREKKRRKKKGNKKRPTKPKQLGLNAYRMASKKALKYK